MKYERLPLLTPVSEDIGVFIFARGGSKRVPGKNLRLAGGISLLDRALSQATQIANPNQIWLSTDSDEIADVGERYGVAIIRRGPQLAGDDSPEWLAWQHAISEVYATGRALRVFLSLPVTAPLRELSDIAECLRLLDEETDCVVGVSDAKVNPYFNLVAVDQDGYIAPVSGDGTISSSQAAPSFKSITTVAYALRPEFILSNEKIWDGRVKPFLVPEERAMDIDSEWDLHVSDLVLNYRNNGRV